MDEELANISNLQNRADRFLQNLITFEASKIKGFMERQIMREPQTIVTTRVEIITGLIARSHRSMTGRIAIAAEENKWTTDTGAHSLPTSHFGSWLFSSAKIRWVGSSQS